MKDHFTVQASVLPKTTRVASFRGNEALSSLYSFEVNLLIPSDEELELSEVVGDRVTLTVNPDTGFAFHGVIATFELLNEASGYSLFRATIVPKLWYLTLSHHSRVFVGDSLTEIIEKILKSGGLVADDYELRLNGAYKPIDHVCQYHESDFAFISRWMEREGLYYFFEQGDEREKLVITDSAAFHGPLSHKPVRFFPQTGEDVSAGASLDTFICRQTTLPTKVKLVDYDPIKPSFDLNGSSPIAPSGAGELHIYGENFLTPEEGKHLAKMRSEELLAVQTLFKGDGRVYNLRSGYTFVLEEHPRLAFNADYLTTAVHHYGNQSAIVPGTKKLLELEYDEPYHVQIHAIPTKVQYRSGRKTPLPRVFGTEEAVIDAEDGHPYAEIDEHGRYKVKLKLDESDLEDGKASMWVRMLQPHGGDIEGFHFPLRKGTEVMVVFLGGDPDRPVITGVAHNAHNPSSVRSANHTRNVIQTGGSNRMEMEDTEGAQWFKHSSPPTDSYLFMGAIGHDDHNVVLKTSGGTGLFHTGSDMDVRSMAKLTEEITGAVTETYHSTKNTTITAAVVEAYNATVTQHYASHHEIKVAGGGRVEAVNGGYNQTVHGGLEQTITGSYKTDITPDYTIKVAATIDQTATDVDWHISNDVKITCNNWEVTQEGNVIWKMNGAFSWLTMSNSAEKFIGFKESLFVGGLLETSIGAKACITLGAFADITIGARADITVAAAYECTAGPHAEAKTAHVKAKELEATAHAAEMQDVEARIANIEADIASGAVFTRTFGIVIFM